MPGERRRPRERLHDLHEAASRRSPRRPAASAYQFTQIDPQDCTDGGAPTGNIRVAFLYNPARVALHADAGGGTLVNTTIVNVGGQARLAAQPGTHRPRPTRPSPPAASRSRRSSRFNGQTFIVVANHWNSKGGDYPEYGRFQPPVLTSEVQRLQIAAVVKNFVQSALTIDPTRRW